MADAGEQSVLKRMVAAGRDSAGVASPASPARAFGTALCRTAEAEATLAVMVEDCTERIASLSELLDSLPEHGLLGLLEGPAEAQGLIAFDHGFLSALIEKQTTGRIQSAPPSPRRTTRTDAALAADVMDAVLRRFEGGLAGRGESQWASGFGYSGHVESVRPLGLVLEDIDYRIITLRADLEQGARTGAVILALPAIGRGPAARATTGPVDDPARAFWLRALATNVEGGDVRLEAVMHRFRMPIREIAQLIPGEEIPLPVSSIDNVRFVTSDGHSFGCGRLGQSRGYRAVRLHNSTATKEQPAIPFAGVEIAPSGVPDGLKSAAMPDGAKSEAADQADDATSG
ncbi:FliM/FliN family flagellar motor switch protein [Tropicimonas sp.]|uniref:FliM/FliN family flagellar motor switch protein n=1 Tax=Tropicimonas sp. TaxID=2067044 RepID=UPI003A83CFF8